MGTRLTEAAIPKLNVPGVKQVLVRYHLPVLLRADNGLESIDLIGVHPAQEKQAAAYWKKTVKGAYLSEDKGACEETIFLSQAIVQRLNVALGDRVSLIDRRGTYLKSLKISGFYQTGMSTLDQGVAFCAVQALPPGVHPISAAIFLEAGAPLEMIVDQYRRVLPSASFATWREFMPDLKQLIDLSNFCMDIVIFLVFAIVSVGIASTFLLFTLKNLREHGVMKAMGFTSRETAVLLLSQIGLLTLAAATIGTLIGALMVVVFSHTGIDISTYISHNQYFAVSGMLYPRLTGFALFAPPFVAVIFSLIAAVWPITYVLRKDPADILRSV